MYKYKKNHQNQCKVVVIILEHFKEKILNKAFGGIIKIERMIKWI